MAEYQAVTPQQVAASDSPAVFASRSHKSEQAIWQRRFWEHRIRDEQDFSNHIDYIHYNPVKHGYVKRPVDWAHISFPSSGLEMPTIKLCLTFRAYKRENELVLFSATPSGAWQ